MKWRRLKRKIRKYLFDRVTFTFIPHSRGQVKSFRLPRIIFIFLILIVAGYISTATYLSKDFKEKYKAKEEQVLALQQVKQENVALKRGLTQIVKETEEMRQAILELQKKGHNIASLISDESVTKKEDDMQDLIIFNYKLLESDTVQAVGGGESLLESDGFELLGQARQELRMLRVEVPYQKKSLNSLESDIKEHNALLAATPTGWPLDDKGKSYISSKFGFRKDPITHEQAFHDGLDVGVWYGTPVLATANGRVTYSGWKSGYGRVVFINHGYGYMTVYGHNSKLAVKAGERIKRGDVIAYTGNSGKSTGPHLHYEVRVNGVPKNPWEFIKPKR